MSVFLRLKRQCADQSMDIPCLLTGDWWRRVSDPRSSACVATSNRLAEPPIAGLRGEAPARTKPAAVSDELSAPPSPKWPPNNLHKALGADHNFNENGHLVKARPRLVRGRCGSATSRERPLRTRRTNIAACRAAGNPPIQALI